jgi:hypothetical protein
MSRPKFLKALHPEAGASPVPERNPFEAASADLAERWETMRVERDAALDEVSRTRGDVTYFSSEVDRLKRELETRVAFFQLEVDRLTARTDRAVEDAATLRGKLSLIGQSIRMVLDSEVPLATRQVDPQGDIMHTPKEGHEVETDAVSDIRDLMSRLPAVSYPTC